jgi:hypothetical protein
VHEGLFKTGSLRRSGRYPQFLKSQLLREAYQRLVDDPDVKDLTEELALSRLLCAGMMAKIKATSVEDLTSTEAAAISAMLDQVCKVAEAMGRIEAKLQVSISVSQLAMVTEQAARLFYQELLGVVRSVTDPANAKELELRIPAILQRIAAALEASQVPFSPAAWVARNGAETVPASARMATP